MEVLPGAYFSTRLRTAVEPRTEPASCRTNAPAAGITVYELARIMGTGVSMIEAHYGALLDTAHTGLLDRLESFGALEGREQNAEDA
jgi:hypothetical protein